MKLPQMIDYQQAMQHPHMAFVSPELKRSKVQLNPRGEPSVASGGFALTFAVTVNAQPWAIRCFHKQGDRMHDRYAAIADFVRRNQHSLDFLVGVEYIPNGINVNGAVLPIVRMPWITATRLSYWIEDNLTKPNALDHVRGQLANATTRLRAAGAAHGDLQHGNVLVDGNSRVRFVDYDGMFVPSLSGLGTLERGHPSYQHPDRGDTYDPNLDIFATYVIDLSLDALGHEPALWHDFYNDNNLIFTASDFASPERSPLFARLARIPALAQRARRLMDASTADFAAMPAILAGERVAARPATARRRRVTGPLALSAKDKTGLLGRVGDVVTVVGKILYAKEITTKHATPMTFVNFAAYQQAGFVIVAYGPNSDRLRRRFGHQLAELKGAWVSITGLVTQYQDRRGRQPQIELKGELRVVSEAQAKAMLNPEVEEELPQPPPPLAPPPSGVYRWAAPPKPPKQPKPAPHTTADDVDVRASQLFATPGFVQTPAAPPPAPGGQHPPPWPRPVVAHRQPRLGWWQRLRRRLGL